MAKGQPVRRSTRSGNRASPSAEARQPALTTVDGASVWDRPDEAPILAPLPGRALPHANRATTDGGPVRRTPGPPPARALREAITEASGRTMAETSALLTVPTLLPVTTTARILACSPRTVRRRIAAGELPAVIEHDRTMVRGDELRAYIDQLARVGASPPRRRRSERRFDFLRDSTPDRNGASW
jgi:hypothetical protein